MRARLGITVAAALCAAACSSGGERGPADAGADGSPDAASLPEASECESLGPDAVEEAGCGHLCARLRHAAEPPDLLLVVDRSGSMGAELAGTGRSKWEAMRDALVELVGDIEDLIHMGLLMFPCQIDCIEGRVDIPIHEGAARAIQTRLGLIEPGGGTPTAEALAIALSTLRPRGPQDRHVLLATDGVPNDADAALAALDALAAERISTFVLGFGDGLAGDLGLLAEMAVRGATGQAYFADTPETLREALRTIVGGVLPCGMVLASPPPDPDLVTVLLDGQPVPRDPARESGWDYQGNDVALEFFGEYCERLQTGSAVRVDFLYGCPEDVIE